MVSATKCLAFTFLALAGVSAVLSFPGVYYPGNQYGYQSSYYQGPWGEVMVYGAHGYFPNWNGYAPYGIRTYGHMYTPWDMRVGSAGRGYYGGYGGYGYGGRYVTQY